MPTNPSDLWMCIDNQQDRTVVRFPTGVFLSEANSDAFSTQLESLIDQLEKPHIVLDLTGVALLSSVILGKLTKLNDRMLQSGGRLTIANPGPSILQVFRVTRLDTVLDITPPPGG